MSSPEKPDMWCYASLLANRLLEILSGRGDSCVGGYDVDASLDVYHINIKGGDFGGVLIFDDVNKTSLKEVSYWDGEINHRLRKNEIDVNPGSGYGEYPNFEYKWSSGNGDAQSRGELTFLRVNLVDRSVNYRGPEWKAIALDDKAQPDNVPNYLKGSRILDKPIPWKIDYDQKAWEILKRSSLEQVVIALENSRE